MSARQTTRGPVVTGRLQECLHGNWANNHVYVCHNVRESLFIISAYCLLFSLALMNCSEDLKVEKVAFGANFNMLCVQFMHNI